MFSIKKLFGSQKSDTVDITPKVGMMFDDKTWGDHTVIEITRVSKCGNNVMYKFKRLQGKNIVDSLEHELQWAHLKRFYTIRSEITL